MYGNNFEKYALKDRQSLHIYIIIHIMRIYKMLISYIKLDHTLHSINYGTTIYSIEEEEYMDTQVLTSAFLVLPSARPACCQS